MYRSQGQGVQSITFSTSYFTLPHVHAFAFSSSYFTLSHSHLSFLHILFIFILLYLQLWLKCGHQPKWVQPHIWPGKHLCVLWHEVKKTRKHIWTLAGGYSKTSLVTPPWTAPAPFTKVLLSLHLWAKITFVKQEPWRTSSGWGTAGWDSQRCPAGI